MNLEELESRIITIEHKLGIKKELDPSVVCKVCCHSNSKHYPNWTRHPNKNTFNGWRCVICDQVCRHSGDTRKPLELVL